MQSMDGLRSLVVLRFNIPNLNRQVTTSVADEDRTKHLGRNGSILA